MATTHVPKYDGKIVVTTEDSGEGPGVARRVHGRLRQGRRDGGLVLLRGAPANGMQSLLIWMTGVKEDIDDIQHSG